MYNQLTASIVLYNNDPLDIEYISKGLIANNPHIHVCFVDNSNHTDLKNVCLRSIPYSDYIFTKSNVGYGAGHNFAIQKYLYLSKYHIVLNPDITIPPNTINQLFNFMEMNPDIGLVMPQVRYPNGSNQYLCKLLPDPLDLIWRRFCPVKSLTEKRNKIYELQFTGYNKIMEIPYLSGCFMFIRNKVLQHVGLFDENIFMYLEDVDLSRRIGKFYKTVFFPDAFVVHRYEKGSYKNIRLLLYHIQSACYYFSKWGWFMDKERIQMNQDALQKIVNQMEGNRGEDKK